ncbi:hypothetical protein BBJ28_00015151 [Nothophytophthora sp. Chile5]|nr:hypothetical protein BBJ28_00015151 [Nothophytophthora sp. Chile5]
MRGGIRVSLEVTCSSYSRDQAGLHLQCTRAVWVFARDGEGASSKRRPLRFAQAPMRSLALLSAPHFEAYVADRLEVAAYHQTRRVNGSGVCKTLKVKGEERATTTKVTRRLNYFRPCHADLLTLCDCFLAMQAALCPAVEQHVVAPRAVVRLVVDQLREDEITVLFMLELLWSTTSVANACSLSVVLVQAVMRPAVEQPVVAAPRVVVSPVAELPVVAPRVVASPVVELPVVAPRTSVQPVVELPLVAPRTSVRPAVLRRPSARSAQVCPLPINHQQDARYMAYKQSQAYNEKREACLARRRAGEDRLGLQAAKTKADEAAAQARKQVAKAPTRIQKVSSRVLAYENTPAYMEARKRNQIRRAKLQSARG